MTWPSILGVVTKRWSLAAPANWVASREPGDVLSWFANALNLANRQSIEPLLADRKANYIWNLAAHLPEKKSRGVRKDAANLWAIASHQGHGCHARPHVGQSVRLDAMMHRPRTSLDVGLDASMIHQLRHGERDKDPIRSSNQLLFSLGLNQT